MTPRLVDTDLSDAFRDGLDEERRYVATHMSPQGTAASIGDRAAVLARMRRWEIDMHALTARIERLRGRHEADNQWLNQHPEGGS